MYQFIIASLYLIWVVDHFQSSSSPSLSSTSNTSNNHKKETNNRRMMECDILYILMKEKEILKYKLDVHMDQQYSFWHYSNYHIPLEIIKSGIQLTNDEIQQIDLLIYILLFFFYHNIIIVFDLKYQKCKEEEKLKKRVCRHYKKFCSSMGSKM